MPLRRDVLCISAQFLGAFAKLQKGTVSFVVFVFWGCATNRKVAGAIPDGVIGVFH